MASKRHDITPRGQRKLSRRVSDEDVAGTLPSGPSTTRDLFDWPSDLVKQIFLDNVHGAGRELQFRSITQHGVHVYTDYSGMDCPREACRVLDQALQLHLPHYQETKFHFLRSCDFGVPQQAVLLAIARELDDNNTCVFSDINHRLPPADQAFLDAMLPEGSAASHAEGYQQMRGWLRENSDRLFNPDSVCHCLVHNKPCLVRPSQVHPVTAPQTPLVSDDGEPALDPARPLRVNVAGTTCKGWSGCGKLRRFADPSERPHAIWLEERRAFARQGFEDMFFSENVQNYPVQEKLVTELMDTHHVLHVEFSPHMQGWPVRRPRMFSAALSKSTLRFVGPKNYEEDFYQLFKRSVQLSADDLFVASEEDIDKEFRRMLSNRGLFPDPGKLLRPDFDLLRQCLPPGAAMNFDQYSELRSQYQGKNGEFVADLQQRPQVGRSQPGPLWPCQLTHGTLVSWKLQRPACGMEHLSAQGFHVFKDCSEMFFSPMMKILDENAQNHLRLLAGNGMHLAAWSAWFLYVLSHIVRVDSAPSIGMCISLGAQAFQRKASFGGVEHGIGIHSEDPDEVG